MEVILGWILYKNHWNRKPCSRSFNTLRPRQICRCSLLTTFKETRNACEIDTDRLAEISQTALTWGLGLQDLPISWKDPQNTFSGCLILLFLLPSTVFRTSFFTTGRHRSRVLMKDIILKINQMKKMCVNYFLMIKYAPALPFRIHTTGVNVPSLRTWNWATNPIPELNWSQRWQHDVDPSVTPNGNAAFKRKLSYYWLKLLCRRYVTTLVIQGPDRAAAQNSQNLPVLGPWPVKK